jgi:hypothetical protein
LLEKEFGPARRLKKTLPMQPGDVPTTYADIEDLARDVGFRPSTTIEDGIGRFAACFASTTRPEQVNQAVQGNRVEPVGDAGRVARWQLTAN